MFARWFRSRSSTPPAVASRDAQLNVYNWVSMRRQPPDRFAALRVDCNNECNVQCVYCHNHRSADLVPRPDFIDFLHQNVLHVDLFQVGCIMEPTLDPRLCDLLLDVSGSPAKPSLAFVLQTNGILLHMHDALKMRDAGLTHLAVSIDSADPVIHKALRGGTSIAKVARNIERLLHACPTLRADFITTVTRANIDQLEPLIRFGLGLGISHFVLREVFYKRDNDIVDHARMPSLVLAPGEFDNTVFRLQETFQGRASIDAAGRVELELAEKKMLSDSARS